LSDRLKGIGRTVLVTGASGFVGGRVAAVLAEAGWRVTGLDRAQPSAGSRAPGGTFAEFWEADLLDDQALVALDAGRSFRAVVHLAGLLPNRASRRDLFAVNAGGTSAVLEHLAHPGCHFVFFSTGLVYGNQPGPFLDATECQPVDPYPQSKLAAESVVRAWSHARRSPATVLRPSVIYGPGAPAGMLLISLLQALRKGEPFPMTEGEQRRDFLHVDDAARAVAALLERPPPGLATWNLASGEIHTVRQAAELAATVAGRPDLLRVGDLPYRPNETVDYRLDAGALRGALGWHPRILLLEGLERLWKEMR
jgi:nucleoside-diphosphate-sugar epimerase